MGKYKYKQDTLKAIKEVIAIYETYKYIGHYAHCPLCVLYKKDINSEQDCTQCISGQFCKDTGCIYRLCRTPRHGRYHSLFDRFEFTYRSNIAAIYWRRVYKWLYRIPVKYWYDMGTNPRFKYVKQIDKQVYEIYNKKEQTF